MAQEPAKLAVVVDRLIAEQVCADRAEALCEISRRMESGSSWQLAKEFGVLDEDSTSEGFAIEFMTAYNKEIGPKY